MDDDEDLLVVKKIGMVEGLGLKKIGSRHIAIMSEHGVVYMPQHVNVIETDLYSCSVHGSSEVLMV